jgi:hypothetical protein
VTTATYADKVTTVKDRYAERIVRILERIRETLQDAGYQVAEPFDMTCDDYRWSMLVYVESEPEGDVEDGDIDITFQIAESEQFDGTEDGINFSLDIVTVGGRILGGLTPYNYTGDVWVNLDDAEAIEQRFSILEQADPADILDLIV